MSVKTLVRFFASNVLALLFIFSGSVAAENAQEVYADAGNRVFQILIIDKESKEKAAIGSGFTIGAGGLIATNFHVVSNAVHEPAKYDVEYLDHVGGKGALQIEDFDVVHDLALVRMNLSESMPTRQSVVADEGKENQTDKETESAPDHAGNASELEALDDILKPLTISATTPSQGEQVFSLGNPYDLGQTIVPGTYNGLLEQSFYQKLLFSGSLNPGMSGGPALNQAGQVIGVNVATSGNQISFLVPVKYLTDLLSKHTDRGAPLDVSEFSQSLADQLFADQNYKYKLLLEHDWQTQSLGSMRVGADLNEYFKCWGNTNDDEDLMFVSTMKSCSSQDSIYIGPRFTTGAIDTQYAWLTSDELGSYRFHKVFANNFSYMSTRTRASEDDVTNYQCARDFVKPTQAHAEGVWRSVICVRQYKDYPRLFDVLYQGSLLGQRPEPAHAREPKPGDIVEGMPTLEGAGSNALEAVAQEIEKDNGTLEARELANEFDGSPVQDPLSLEPKKGNAVNSDAEVGLASHFALSGVSKENAMAFAAKFLELHQWQ